MRGTAISHTVIANPALRNKREINHFRLLIMASSVGLAEYLFARLYQLGVRSIHGVPGDYNLELLDYVEPSGLHWVGTCNELNAGYATDGYSRIKGLGALITTFGVGELSAINAIAGAYAERAPVVHIVGTPERTLQDSRALVHHTFNDGEYGRFALMHVHVTVAQVNLGDPRTCQAEVDWALEQCTLHSRPVYIQVPVDMVAFQVPSARLDSNISLPLHVPTKSEEPALSHILDRLYCCKQPMILVDGEIRAYRVIEEVNKLVTQTKWPTWTTSFGKGLVDETLPNVLGIYSGRFAKPEVKAYIESSDLVLFLGPHPSGTNSFQSTAIPNPTATIAFTDTTIKAGSQVFRDLPAKHILSKLLEKLDCSKLQAAAAPPLPNSRTPSSSPNNLPKADDPITHRHFWRKMTPFLREGDIVMGETGTAGYGTRDLIFPRHTRYFAPVTWLSIGYMLPAALGAAIAQRELITEKKWGDRLEQGRTLLFIGDGSLQMTVQEISTIIKEKLNVVIFVLNNSGYTIERCIHGRKQGYNDVAEWRYLLAPAFFGGEEQGEYPFHTFKVKTWGELEQLLEKEELGESKGLRMVEILMDPEDAPESLLWLLEKQKERERAATTVS